MLEQPPLQSDSPAMTIFGQACRTAMHKAPRTILRSKPFQYPNQQFLCTQTCIYASASSIAAPLPRQGRVLTGRCRARPQALSLVFLRNTKENHSRDLSVTVWWSLDSAAVQADTAFTRPVRGLQKHRAHPLTAGEEGVFLEGTLDAEAYMIS